jgi:hypothetical protein
VRKGEAGSDAHALQRTDEINKRGKKEKFVTVEITPIIIGVGYKGECV